MILNLRVLITVCSIGLAIAQLAPASAADPLSEAQQVEVERIIEKYLLENPALMIEVLRRVTRFQKEQKEKRVRDNLVQLNGDLYDDPNSVTVGDPHAKVTIVEFFDYRCGYCKRNHPILESFLGQNLDVNIVFKEFPILGPESVFASRVAIASRKQGKYWELHNALMASQANLTERHVFALAKEVGLDLEQLRRDLALPEIDRIIRDNYRLADALGIKGTPGFVIGDNIIPGFLNKERLSLAVDEARMDCLTCLRQHGD